MLLPKSTLEQIEFYVVTKSQSRDEPWVMNDIIRLHFKQWWKSEKVLTIARLTTSVDKEAGSFSHQQTEDAFMLIEQLYYYMESTFPEEEKEKTDATILSIVPRLKDES